MITTGYVKLALLAAVTFILGSCTTPYGIAVDDYDFSHRQRPAAITLSDPQVYARETLVNDRRREVAYLQTLLTQSETIQFHPQLRRDLETITTFVGQAQLSFNEGLGNAYNRDENLREMEHERDLLIAQASLVRAEANLLLQQRRLETFETDGTLPATTPDGEPDPDGSPQNEPEVVNWSMIGSDEIISTTPLDISSEEFKNLTLGEIQSLLAITNNLKTFLDREIGNSPENADIQASPQEVFRDRQAYREELRAALADVNLDDVHDIDGNALYRLQFRASVLPGEHRGQFGAARLTFEPPVLSDDDFEEFYLSWLAHISQVVNDPELTALAFEYELIGRHRGLFDIIEVRDATNLSIDYRLVLPSGYARQIAEYCSINDTCSNDYTFTQRENSPATQNTDFNNLIELCNGSLSPETFDTFSITLQSKINLQTLAPTFEWAMSSAVRGFSMTDRTHENPAEPLNQRNLPPFLSLYRNIYSGLQRGTAPRHEIIQIISCLGEFRKTLASSLPENDQQVSSILNLEEKELIDLISQIDTLNEQLSSLVTGGEITKSKEAEEVVRHFRSAISEVNNDSSFILNGTMAAFAARPVDQSQRLSTVQSAANALDLAFAAQAQIQSQGTNGILGANFVRRSAGRIETLERTPIVVGFVDREISTPEQSESECNFRSFWRDRCSSTNSTRPDNNDQGSTLANSVSLASNNTEPSVHPQAGWIFGPRLVPDGQRNRLVHSQQLMNHGVSADISVPGWWPNVNVRLDTAWIENWSNGNYVLDPNTSRRRDQSFEISLPHNGTDMEALTAHLAGTGFHLERPEIISLSPDNVVLCPNMRNLHIQVRGRNLWRGTQAFLNGIAASDIDVLPDMGGVNLSFPVRNLPVYRSGNEFEAVISVSTRHGTDEVRLNLNPARSGEAFCGSNPNDGGSNPGRIHVENRQWVSEDQNLDIMIEHPQALANRNGLTLEVHEVLDRNGSPIGPAGTKPVQLGAHFDATNGLIRVNFTEVGNFPTNITNGQLVRLTLVLDPNDDPNTPNIRYPVDGIFAYYSAEGAKPAISTESPVTLSEAGETFEVTLKLPPHPDLRFTNITNPRQSLNPDMVGFEANLMGHTLIQLSDWVQDQLQGGSTVNYTGRFRLPTTAIDEASVLAALRASAGATVNWNISGWADESVTSLNGTFKLKLTTPPS